MARYLWCSVANDWVHPSRAAPRPRGPGSDLPRPMLIRDQLDDVWNPADGRVYDSRSNYQRAVKAAGCEIVGNDRAWSEPAPRKHTPLGNVERDISETIDRLSA